MSKIKIFATLLNDGDGYPFVFRIGLNPNAFPSEKFKDIYSQESGIYFQEIDSETEVTDYEEESWEPYNGTFEREYGSLDPTTNIFYEEDDSYFDEQYEALGDKYGEWADSLIDGYMVETYKEGKLIKKEFKSE